MKDLDNLPIRYWVFAAVLAGLCAGLLAAGIIGPPASSDDWRRTADGWQRRSGWSEHVASLTAKTTIHLAAVKRDRFDMHPAAVALFQLVAAMLSLAFFGPRGQALLKENSFSTLLIRSFRASVFGS